VKRSLAHFCSAMGGTLVGAEAPFAGVSTDSRTLRPGELFVALAGPNFDGHDYVGAAAQRGAAGAVVARRLPLAVAQIVVADPLAALQRAAAAWREQFALPLVAVAGSNGKTTTKELIAAILGEAGPCHATRGNLNNHIGVPLTLLELDTRHQSAVVEIGANRAGDVAGLVALVRPTVGILTNAGAEHLEGFGDLDGVARAEGELYAGLAAGATAIINHDDAYRELWVGMSRAARRYSFGLAPGADFSARDVAQHVAGGSLWQAFELLTPAGPVAVRIALAGLHNVVNALGAAAAAHAAGAQPAAIAAGLGKARAVRGRLQMRSGRAGARLLDDSYNANPSSLAVALDVLGALGGERWLVLGDMAELGCETRAAHRAAGQQARAAGVSRLYAVGEATPEAVQAFGPGAEWFADTAALAERVRALLAPGVTVLIKGSRRNRLETVVGALLAADDPAGRPQPAHAS
jgi:UDP-N-acetylmuramoyl-tripeptide--D-alanyl-D-alanine ligase